MGWEWRGKEGGYLQTGRGLMFCMQYDMTLFNFDSFELAFIKWKLNDFAINGINGINKYLSPLQLL